jgi:chromosome segregation ATPase
LFEQAEGEVEWLRVELRQQAKLVTQAQREIVQLRSEVENHQKLCSDAMKDANHLRGDLKSLTATVDELEASNRVRTAQIATLEQENQTTKVEIAKLTKCFNDSLHVANAAKKEIEDQKSAVAVNSVASTESIALVAQDQVEKTEGRRAGAYSGHYLPI